MGFLDELFGAGNAGPDYASDFNGPDKQPGDFDLAGLFKDQNFVRCLGEAGKAVSSGGSAGEVLGDFSTNLIRRRQAQKAAQKTRKEGKTFQEQLLDAVRGGSLLSSKDQNNAFDNFSLDGDGNVSLSMKNTPQKLGYKPNQPLEGRRIPQPFGGADLPDFSNQSSGEIDFAGLDPEDISMLLKAEQQFGELSQRDAQLILQERDRRETLAATSRDNAAKLKDLAEQRRATALQHSTDETAKVTAANTLQDRMDARERLQASLRDNKTLTPLEKEKAQLEIDKLGEEIKKVKAETLKLGRAVSLTPEQVLSADKDTRAALLKIQDEKIPLESAIELANFENSRVNNPVFYKITPTVKDAPGVYKWGDDIPGEVLPIFLPKNPKTGVQITSQDVMDTARANNISPEEVLKKWGLLK